MIRIPLAAALLLAGCAPTARPPSVAAAFEPAPTPDPGSPPPRRGEVEVAPAVLSPYRDGFESNGYPTGSVYRNFEDDPTSRGAGMRVRVPTDF